MGAAHDATNQKNNPLWIYSLKQYANPSCATFLLEAQDTYQLDINILLFIGWLATQGRLLDIQKLKASKIDTWQEQVIQPLRKVRQQAKSLANSDFYQSIKALELDAEYQEQNKLHGISEEMKKQDVEFAVCIRRGCVVYFEGINQKLEDRWLQMLTQHLQPK